MNDDEKTALIKRYSDRLKSYGYSPETLGWSKGKHFLRFKILLESFDLKGKSILDFGCGFGDMYKYIQDVGLDVDYEGIDINSELISKGKEIYPTAKLFTLDVFENQLNKKYDFIFSSGVHNLKLSRNREFIEKSFEFFDQNSRDGFAVNFLSDRVDFRHEHTHHSRPWDILELAYRYSRRVTLRNDYMPFEFTIAIDKRQEFDPKKTVFTSFENFLVSGSNDD